MVLQALQVMLFGMLGIFIVMGVIVLLIQLLKKTDGKNRQPKQDKTDQ